MLDHILRLLCNCVLIERFNFCQVELGNRNCGTRASLVADIMILGVTPWLISLSVRGRFLAFIIRVIFDSFS